MTHVDHPFDPVFNPDSRILILGSLPSVRSRAEGFYYGHPRNRFWQVLATVYNQPCPADNTARRTMILHHRLALWDVIASCDIEGSSDASVKNAIPVDIMRSMEHASIDRVLCNGALAGKLYKQHLQPLTGIEAVVLPSTSPANASWSMGNLTETWKNALIMP